MAESEIDAARIAAVCQVLHDHQVAFVIIGGVAARLHDTGHATVDVDVCRPGPSTTSNGWPAHSESSAPVSGSRENRTAFRSIHTLHSSAS